MSDHVYKIIEIVGSSPDSIEHAIEQAISRAASTLDELRWFEVAETRGHIENGRVAHYQVTLRHRFLLARLSAPRVTLPWVNRQLRYRSAASPDEIVQVFAQEVARRPGAQGRIGL